MSELQLHDFAQVHNENGTVVRIREINPDGDLVVDGMHWRYENTFRRETLKPIPEGKKVFYLRMDLGDGPDNPYFMWAVGENHSKAKYWALLQLINNWDWPEEGVGFWVFRSCRMVKA